MILLQILINVKIRQCSLLFKHQKWRNNVTLTFGHHVAQWTAEVLEAASFPLLREHRKHTTLVGRLAVPLYCVGFDSWRSKNTDLRHDKGIDIQAYRRHMHWPKHTDETIHHVHPPGTRLTLSQSGQQPSLQHSRNSGVHGRCRQHSRLASQVAPETPLSSSGVKRGSNHYIPLTPHCPWTRDTIRKTSGTQNYLRYQEA